MRTFLAMLFICGLFSGPKAIVRADDQTSATAIVDTAIKAHGGLDNLMKTQKIIRKATGVMSFFGQEVPFTDELVLQLPERSRYTLEGGPQGQKTRFILVYDGDKAWQSAASATSEAPKDRLDMVRDEIYFLWLASLVPLKTHTGFTLAVLADAKVNDRNASTILVSREGRPDLKLFFDKASGLLVKAERKTKEAGVPMEKEYFYANYRNVGGVNLPTRYQEQSNGKKVVDVSSISYEFLSSVDDKLFAKP
jgi:hypothetical protein